MKISEQFEKALLKLTRTEYDDTATGITDYNEEEQQEGYCSTCNWTSYWVQVDYRTATGSYGTYRYQGTFADLIRKLDEYGD